MIAAPRARHRTLLAAMAAAILGGVVVVACSHTPDDPPPGPDCARLAPTDPACIDYARACNVDADCAPRSGQCTSDAATAIAYSGPVCESGYCGYSVTATACGTPCAGGACPGDAGTD